MSGDFVICKLSGDPSGEPEQARIIEVYLASSQPGQSSLLVSIKMRNLPFND